MSNILNHNNYISHASFGIIIWYVQPYRYYSMPPSFPPEVAAVSTCTCAPLLKLYTCPWEKGSNRGMDEAVPTTESGLLTSAGMYLDSLTEGRGRKPPMRGMTSSVTCCLLRLLSTGSTPEVLPQTAHMAWSAKTSYMTES